MNKRRIFIILFGILAAVAVVILIVRQFAPPPTVTVETPPSKKAVSINSPAFNADSAYYYTQKQVDFGPRDMNSKAHDECGKWLIQIMKPLVDTVYAQKFE